MTDPIVVDYEQGRLREVILGRGVMRYPDVERARWAAEGMKALPDAEAEKVRQRSGRDSRDLEKYALVERENEELLEIFARHGVVVHRPDPLTDEQVAANYGREWLPNGYIQTFSRDPMFVVGDNVIELAPGAPNRRAEMLGYRRLSAAPAHHGPDHNECPGPSSRSTPTPCRASSASTRISAPPRWR